MITLIMYMTLAGVFCWWAILLAPWRAWSVREQLEPSIGVEVNRFFSDVTVLIPARNEAQFIDQTLSKLQAQGEDLRIIVIDDQSEDRTATLAKRPGVEIISGTTPPKNWSGKLWALDQGLQQVRTQYTLLLDADISLSPGILEALLNKAHQENLSLVSLMAELPVKRFSERLLVPAFIFFFKLLYPFRLSNKPESRMAAAAGGCILVKTSVLKSINAFTSIHNALIDDCTLATLVKQAGFKTWIGLSHAVQSHRGYDSLAAIWNTVARTAFTQLHYSLLLLFLCTLIMTSMFWCAPLSAIIYADKIFVASSVLTWLAMLIVYTPVLRFYRSSPLWGAALPVTGTLYLLMTWTSAFRYWRGIRAHWKNRRYEASEHN
ncbi:hopene-associated glycosyltransferase HpnB [Nitrosomonas eutropha]|uniref:glycosyltransferase n=1 Tax=Nitrosomonas eutropha TaxID=916 RepID=UPI00088BA327|nr:glycosyltransferase [Nitrosomonas eutropha]SCW99872.1 hopene-associated glycosyltransferase HpnB [Nitrosomonas eutropha]